MGPPSYMRSVVDRNVVVRRMTVLNRRLSVLQCQSGSNVKEINIVSLPGSSTVPGSAARSLVTMFTEIIRLRMAVQLEEANLYIEGLQLKMRFEILTESDEEDSGIPRTKVQKCKLTIRFFMFAPCINSIETCRSNCGNFNCFNISVIL